MDRQVEAEKMRGDGTSPQVTVSATGLLLQTAKRHPAQRNNEPAVDLVEFPQVALEVQGNRICHWRGGAGILAPVHIPDVLQVPRGVDPKMPHDEIDRVARSFLNLFQVYSFNSIAT